MKILMCIFFLLGIFSLPFAYRLGIADGLAVARRGRLAGSRADQQEDLLKQIDAYNGRKGPYGNE